MDREEQANRQDGGIWVAAITGIGAALVAVGSMATVAAMSIGGLASMFSMVAGAVGLVVAAVGALFTPIGLVVAARGRAGWLLSLQQRGRRQSD